MEQQYRKHTQQKHQQKLEREKSAFFKQVFAECQLILPGKQFQFFTKCIMPQHMINNMSSSNNRKNRDSALAQREPCIDDINPNALTMPRRGHFYQEKPSGQVTSEVVNRRILTTPTQKVRNTIKFSSYEEYQFHQKMKKYQQKLADQSKGNKMYCPEALFYPSNHIQIPKIMLHVDDKKRQKPLKTNKYNNFQTLTAQKNSEAIPDDFVEILRSSKNYSTFRYSKFCKSTKNTKSVR